MPGQWRIVILQIFFITAELTRLLTGDSDCYSVHTRFSLVRQHQYLNFRSSVKNLFADAISLAICARNSSGLKISFPTANRFQKRSSIRVAEIGPEGIEQMRFNRQRMPLKRRPYSAVRHYLGSAFHRPAVLA